MDYTTALNELRQMIADTQFTKRATKKELTGNADGANKLFYAYDKRIFSSTFQLFIDNVQVTSGFELTDPIAGEITFKNAPDKGVTLRANYYWSWWTDEEITNFLNKGAELTGQVDPNISGSHKDSAYLQIEPGLKNAALKFAGHLANESLVMYFVARKHSSEFLLEQDGNVDLGYTELVKTLQTQASTWFKEGVQLRDDFYKRQGRRNAPAFAIKQVATRRYGPQR